MHKSLLVVCNPDGVMVGIISKTDIVRQIAYCEGSRCTTPAEAVMRRDVTYCHPSDSLHDNAIVLRDGTGNRKLDKDGYLGRIDGLVALVMAMGVTPIEPARTIDVSTLVVGLDPPEEMQRRLRWLNNL
jgi:hypothetical protein